MKTLIFYLLAAIGTLPAFAQQGERIFKRFKGDVSAGFAMPCAPMQMAVCYLP